MSSRVADASSLVFGAWKSRPKSKRVLTAASLLMMLGGAGLFSYPLLTDLYSSRQQDKLSEEFVSPEFQDKFSAGNVADGQPLTRIKIPAIGLDALVVEGTDPRALRAGAGHYRETPLPCRSGNVGIAGHRTTYGKPFNRLDELKAGQEIILVLPNRECRYRIVAPPPAHPRPNRRTASWITHPLDSTVLARMDGSMLTLTTCHPKGSAAKRLILRAELVEG